MIPLEITSKFKITSKYGWRTHPITKEKNFHHGVDIIDTKKEGTKNVNVTKGNKIYATANGKVVKVVNKGKHDGTMCQIRIQHKDYQSAYYHNESGSAKVKVGDYVNGGDYIAIAGMTGGATGYHLHFQIDKGTKATSIDPTEYAKGEKELEGLLDLKLGNYVVISPRYIRYGAGVNYDIKKVKELTKNGQKHCTSTNPNAKAQYKKDTTFTVEELRYATNGAVWGRSPSGWLCLRSHSGVNYCKKK